MTHDSGLFWDIERHLLNDAKPSQYLEEIASLPAFSQYPFLLLKRLQTTRQPPKYHAEGSVWNHTLMVVDEAANVKDQSENPRAFMWTALLHDIGKPSTTRIRNGKITSYEHEAAGERLAGEFLREFVRDEAFVRAVCRLVRYHMQVLFVLRGLPFADIGAIRENVDIHELALFGFCDRVGRANSDRRTENENMRLFIQKCRREKGEKNMAKAGMRRPDPKAPHGTESNEKMNIPKNDAGPVPEIQGKAKTGKDRANPA
jgi:putative nucleotidyltransferase with HDIG domain